MYIIGIAQGDPINPWQNCSTNAYDFVLHRITLYYMNFHPFTTFASEGSLGRTCGGRG